MEPLPCVSMRPGPGLPAGAAAMPDTISYSSDVVRSPDCPFNDGGKPPQQPLLQTLLSFLFPLSKRSAAASPPCKNLLELRRYLLERLDGCLVEELSVQEIQAKLQKLRSDLTDLIPDQVSAQKEEYNYLVEEVRKLQEENSAMRRQVELLNAKQSVAETLSYEDGTPIPPMLHTAVRSAQTECQAFTKELLATLKAEYKLSILFVPPPGAVMKAGDEAAATRLALQAAVCRAFFRSFEMESFDADKPGGSRFQPPEVRRQQWFQEYKESDGTEPVAIAANGNEEFRRFGYTKLSCFAEELASFLRQNKTTDEGTIEELCQAVCRRWINIGKDLGVQEDANIGADDADACGTGLSIMFWRLAKATWLLHKLAFSFQPTAEILWIASGSVFHDTFMEMINRKDTDSADEEITPHNWPGIPPALSVMFTVMPGFTLRNHVVKALVYLQRDA